MALAAKTFADLITFTRASTATYWDSAGRLQTAASGAARIDYNPSTLAVRGLRVETQATNLLIYSEDLRNTAEAGATRPWVQFVDGDTTVSLVTATNFKGVSGSVSKVQCATTGAVQRQTSQGFTGTDNTVYCVSCFAKAAEVSRLRLNFSTKALTYPNADFNLLTGTVASTAGAVLSHGIEPIGNGYYRCWVAASPPPSCRCPRSRKPGRTCGFPPTRACLRPAATPRAASRRSQARSSP